MKKSKKSKKSKLNLLVYIPVGLLAASSIGFGSYFIYKAIHKDSGNFEGYVELGTPKTIWYNSGVLNDDNAADPSWDFQIKVYPYQNGKYWLDDNGIKELRESIHKKLYHGQEITTLDGMVFGDVNMIGKDSNGLYFPLTKETFYNISIWENHPELTNKEKIDGIISTVTHEYGHHIANMYLTTSYSNQAWDGDDGNVPEAQKADGSWDLTNWNSEFTEKFYRTLHYDDKTLLFGKGGLLENDPDVPREGSIHQGWIDEYKATSIASSVSLNHLFWNANSNNPDNKIHYNEKHQVFGLPGYKNDFAGNGAGNRGYVDYRYSLDEIVTRQLGQLMHVYDYEPGYLNDSNAFRNMLKRNSGMTIHQDSFVLDATASAKIRFDSYHDRFESKAFYRDSIFSNTKKAEDIYDAFRESMGYHKMISNIYGMNKTHAFVDKETGDKYANYDDGGLDQHKFKITGWTPKGVKGLYYGYVDNNGKIDPSDLDTELMKFDSDEKRKKLWSFDRKDSVFAQSTIDSNPFSKKGEEWLPFSTNKYLESRGGLYDPNLEFRWWEDKNNNGSVDDGEMKTTSEIINKHSSVRNSDVINRVLPISTFRQTWNEGDIFPRIRYLTDIEKGRKKLVIRLY
ncbi:MYPU_1760 family metalloprotease [Mycoplasma todarodis]|uniref:MYPU_1760 family metalloprotease n=1 Tax=Mycoplasma todarodis TaxID=1937191 RepID=UPI003B34DB39